MKWLKNNAPIIMIGYTLVNTILYYSIDFEIYVLIYPYLSQGIGFSLFTSLVFFTFYFNKHYCNSIKISVIGLILMNIIATISYIYDANSFVYDLYICSVCLIVYLTYKLKPLKNKNYV